MPDLYNYNLALKTDPKNTLTAESSGENISVPQTIVHHGAKVNAFYSPLFCGMTTRVFSLVKPTVHVQSRKRLNDMKRFLDRTVNACDDSIIPLEIDISKFDKSQQASQLRWNFTADLAWTKN